MSTRFAGHKHTAESKAQISATLSGRQLSPVHRYRIGAAQRGKPKSPEAIAKTAAARRGKPGKPHTAETRERMSVSATARHRRRRLHKRRLHVSMVLLALSAVSYRKLDMDAMISKGAAVWLARARERNDPDLIWE